MGLFGERHDLLRQLAAAQAHLESVQDQRNSLDARVRRLEHQAQLLAGRELRLREALEVLVSSCAMESCGPGAAAALQMARAVLHETAPEE